MPWNICESDKTKVPIVLCLPEIYPVGTQSCASVVSVKITGTARLMSLRRRTGFSNIHVPCFYMIFSALPNDTWSVRNYIDLYKTTVSNPAVNLESMSILLSNDFITCQSISYNCVHHVDKWYRGSLCQSRVRCFILIWYFPLHGKENRLSETRLDILVCSISKKKIKTGSCQQS